MEHQKYVIVGGGVAGICAAKAIRDQDEGAEIVIYSSESGLPYNRIKLSKGLFTDLHSDKILIKKEKWFQQNNIRYCGGTRIAAIQPLERIISTADGQKIGYDKLLLCPGAINRKLELEGAELPQVHHIRTRQDADRLKEALRAGERVCVIGGGVQGIETAWSLQQAGYIVTIVEQAPRLMMRQLDEEASAILAKQITSYGNQVVTGQAVDSIVGSQCVEGVRLGDGTVLPCDHIVYSIGIIPNTELAKQSGIKVNRGIIVNEHMQTSDEHIYAAGDAAEFMGKVDGLWNTAMEQGKVAGTHMAHGAAAYHPLVPMTVFTAYELPLFSIGQTDKQPCHFKEEAPSEAATYRQLFIENGKICGAIVFDTVLAASPYKEAIEQALPVMETERGQYTLQQWLTQKKEVSS